MAIGFSHYREVERQLQDHERRTYTPTDPRADDPTESQDHRNDEPTESRKRDHAEPDNVGETVSWRKKFKSKHITQA